LTKRLLAVVGQAASWRPLRAPPAAAVARRGVPARGSQMTGAGRAAGNAVQAAPLAWEHRRGIGAPPPRRCTVVARRAIVAPHAAPPPFRPRESMTGAVP